MISTLETSERAQLIRETEAIQPGRVNYIFLHALIHATIYEGVSGLRRQQLHRRATVAIEAIRPDDFESLTAHYLEGGDLERARKNALKAGERALGLFANQDAEKYFKMNLELGGTEAEKAMALSGLGQALSRQSCYIESIDTWKQAIPIYRQLRNFDQVARTYACLSEAARQMGDIEAGIAYGEEGLAQLIEQPATPGKIALMRETGYLMSMRGWLEKAIALFRHALEKAERIGNIEEQVETLIHLGYELCFSNQTDRSEGFQMLERALTLAESSGLITSAEMAHTYISEFFENEGDMRGALDHNEKAIRLSRQIGSTYWELFNLNWLSFYKFIQGNIKDAELLIERSRYLAELIGFPGTAVLGFRFREAHMLYARRDTTQTFEMMQKIYRQACQTHNINVVVVLTQKMVECMIIEKMWKEAEEILSETLQIWEQEEEPLLYYFLAIVYSHQEKLVEAHDMLEKVRVVTGPVIGFWDKFYLAFAEASLACEEERWDEAWQHFDKAYELVAQAGIHWQEAYILRNRAEALLKRDEAGDKSRAAELLEKTMHLYQEMQLPEWVHYIENSINKIRENIENQA